MIEYLGEASHLEHRKNLATLYVSVQIAPTIFVFVFLSVCVDGFPHLEPSPKPTPCPVEASHLEHVRTSKMHNHI